MMTANGNKKAVTYARREDAILHALEIENARLGKDRIDFILRNNLGGELGSSSAKELPSMSDSGKEEIGIMGEESDSGDLKDESNPGSGSGSGSALELSQSGLSFEEPNHFSASKVQSVQGKKRKTPNDSEDDGTEEIKRMRGLEDLGMVVGDLNAGNYFSNGSPLNGNKGHNSSMKRKRTQVANVHEFLKRKNRRRPLTKVLESTAMVSVPVICDQIHNSNGSPLHGLSDSKVSGIESNESRKSFSAMVNNNSDRTGVSCENGASINPSEHACDASLAPCKMKKDNDVSGVAGSCEKDSLDRLFDVPFVREVKHSAGFFPGFVPISARNQVGGLGRQSNQSSQVEIISLENKGFNESGSTSSAIIHIDGISQRMEKGTSKWQLKGKRNTRHASKNRKQDKRKYIVMDVERDAYLPGMEHIDGFFLGSNQKLDGVRDWSKSFSHLRVASSEPSVPPQRLLPLRQSRFTVNSRYQTSDFPGRTLTESKLYDVKLEVKANYQPQNVPLVSLMSKLNGKAIIGRPLTIEFLADGHSDLIIGSRECDPAGELAYPPIGNPEAGRVPTKLIRMQRRLSSIKSPKRKSGLLSKKIRKLSSLTGNKEEYNKPVVEKTKGPVIACIPLKIVFSRINEAVNVTA